MSKIHVFEEAGLGKAPYQYIGSHEHHSGGVMDYGTNCDFCGQYIRSVFTLKSSDGKLFHVGSDCINKAGDRGLKKFVSEELKKRRSERLNLSFKDYRERFADYEDDLSNVCHPYHRSGTMADYCRYIFDPCREWGDQWASESQKNRVVSAFRKIEKSRLINNKNVKGGESEKPNL
jgi:hypothetical protein